MRSVGVGVWLRAFPLRKKKRYTNKGSGPKGREGVRIHFPRFLPILGFLVWWRARRGLCSLFCASPLGYLLCFLKLLDPARMGTRS